MDDIRKPIENKRVLLLKQAIFAFCGLVGIYAVSMIVIIAHFVFKFW